MFGYENESTKLQDKKNTGKKLSFLLEKKNVLPLRFRLFAIPLLFFLSKSGFT